MILVTKSVDKMIFFISFCVFVKSIEGFVLRVELGIDTRVNIKRLFVLVLDSVGNLYAWLLGL